MNGVHTAKTKCPCGAELMCFVKKPNFVTPTVSKVACNECGSRFLLHVEVDKTQKVPRPRNHRELVALSQKPFVREYKSRFEIIRLSEKGSQRSQNPFRRAASLLIEKVSKKDEPSF